MKHVYVGVDTHKWTHTAVIINCFAEKLGEITIQNKPSEFGCFVKSVKAYIKRGITPVFGLEDTASSGRELAIFLLKKKKTVKQVASSLTWSERKNQPINHKTDSYDALCIARILLSKFDELPDADPRDIYWTLGMLVGRRNAVVKSNAALKNPDPRPHRAPLSQLQAILYRIRLQSRPGVLGEVPLTIQAGRRDCRRTCKASP
jgi:hypothetical protein